MGTARLAREGEPDELLDRCRMLDPDDHLSDPGEATNLWAEMCADEKTGFHLDLRGENGRT